MDAMTWALIESERAADEAAETLTGEDLQPVGIADGGRLVYPDGSWVRLDDAAVWGEEPE